MRECPPVACAPSDCGIVPPVWPGTTVTCERVADGSCQWVGSTDPTCSAPGACGPAPATASWICADGSIGGNTGNCIADAMGNCAWEIRACDPAGGCTLDQCGPRPGSPSTICADGTIGGNTGRCIRDATGACGWEQRDCGSTTTCAGLAGTSCAAGQVCIFGVGQCHTPDEQGVCVVPPETCTEEWAPVCGCDGRTYSNACHALGSGMSIQAAGECPSSHTACGGIAGFACPSGQYCDYEIDASGVACGAADALGTCTPIPSACNELDAPVCGCDGTTYSSACFAAAAGISVQHTGACASTTRSCGGFGGGMCAAGEYCNYAFDPTGTACGAADAPGTCTALPAGCPDIVMPVCGCNGTTYFNACEAAAAGQSVARDSAC